MLLRCALPRASIHDLSQLPVSLQLPPVPSPPSLATVCSQTPHPAHILLVSPLCTVPTTRDVPAPIPRQDAALAKMIFPKVYIHLLLFAKLGVHIQKHFFKPCRENPSCSTKILSLQLIIPHKFSDFHTVQL